MLMRSSRRFLLPIFGALLGLFAASAPAYGQLVTTTFGPFTVNCTPSGQLCDNTFSQSVSTISTLRVQYVASPGHCSNVAAHIFVDGVERAVTAVLTPGQASGFFDVGPVSPGPHVVALRGEGTVSGCNTGNLQNWGGTMDVVHEAAVVAAAVTPVPAVSLPLLAVLAAVLVLAAGLAIRRRR
jgi:hypothetical protein